MREMDRRVGLLRLLLADVIARLKAAREASETQRAQLSRVVDFAVRSNVSINNTLAALAEVEERAAQYEMTTRHLTLLRQRIQSELEALVVTRGVADAHARLTALEARRQALLAAPDERTPPSVPSAAVADLAEPANELAEIEAEIGELKATIQTASEAAARALTEQHPSRGDTPRGDPPRAP